MQKKASINFAILFFVILSMIPSAASAADAPDTRLHPGRFIIDPPTLNCLGFAWAFEGDRNRNATATVEYRQTGEGVWRQAQPMLRSGGQHVGRAVDWLDYTLPNMLAGSILDLKEDTEYEVRVTAQDPDGVVGDAVKTVKVRTRAVPQDPIGGHVYEVFPPGSPQADWTKNKCSNLNRAYYGGIANQGDFNIVRERPVQPGDTILVHAGVYKADRYFYTDITALTPDGTYWLTAKGTREKPIVIKGAGDGEAIFDGDNADVLFNVMAADYHTFEGLTFRNCGTAIMAGKKDVLACVGLTVRHCRFENVRQAIYSLNNRARDYYIADNIMIGRNAKDRLTGWGDANDHFMQSYGGIQIHGAGHVVTRNSIAFFWDGINFGTYGSPEAGYECCANDIIGNDIRMIIDDPIETDGNVRNVRVLRNRIMYGGTAISAQPIFGGPAYYIRNVAGDVNNMGLKFHEAYPSGLLTYQNTIIGNNMAPRGMYSNSHFRNNLFLPIDNSPKQLNIGKSWYIYTNRMMAYPDPIGEVTSDYNGFGIGMHFKTSACDPFPPIVDKSRNPWWPLKFYPELKEDKIYETLDEIRAATGLEQHSRMIDYDVFANLQPSKSPQINIDDNYDFTLRPDGAAIGAGIPLANINDGFTGKAPDLGAYLQGQPAPAYGTSVKEDADYWWSIAGPQTGENHPAEQNNDWQVVISKANSYDFVLLRGNQRIWNTSLIVSGPGWKNVPLQSHEKATGDDLQLSAPLEVNKADGQVIILNTRVWKSGDKEVSFHYDLTAKKDVMLQQIIARIILEDTTMEGDVLLKHRDGSEGKLPLDVGGPAAQPETGTMTFRFKALGNIIVTMDPPVLIPYDHKFKMQLAADVFKAGKQSFIITYHFPDTIHLLLK